MCCPKDLSYYFLFGSQLINLTNVFVLPFFSFFLNAIGNNVLSVGLIINLVKNLILRTALKIQEFFVGFIRCCS